MFKVSIYFKTLNKLTETRCSWFIVFCFMYLCCIPVVYCNTEFKNATEKHIEHVLKLVI